MRRIRDCLRLHFESNLNQVQIAQSLGIARSTVQDYLSRLKVAQLTYESTLAMSDADVENSLFRKRTNELAPHMPRAVDIDGEHIHRELAKKGVTIRVLWEEYRGNHPNGYAYSQYCWHYQQWCKILKMYMRQHHIAGEKVFVDYSGKKPVIVNRATGEITEVELFVMCWGYSHYTYAEAQPSQEQEYWIKGHVRGIDFFGCVPSIITPDNYKGAVTKAHRYDPDINRAYTELSEYYNFGVVPARSRSPKDKAKVECGVLIVQRWILARLRNRVFHTIHELNLAIRVLLDDLNNRKMQKREKSRKEFFEEVDKPAAQALPAVPFAFRKHYNPTVNLDYHVEIDKRYYSVPWKLCRKKVQAYLENGVISIFYNESRVALHHESTTLHTFSTHAEHMPPQHRAIADWSLSVVLLKAQKCGPFTEKLIQKIITTKIHPQQGFRPSQGILRLGEAYGNDRLENACEIALERGLNRVQQISDLLKNKKDIPPEACAGTVDNANNVRGQEYYAQKEGSQ